MSKINKRNILLDALKGFTIILVVLGHSIQYVQNKAFDSNLVFRLIYSFHMPLFMFISGFVSFKTFDGSWNKLLKRFKSLIIPFWAWFIFSFFVSYLIYIFNGVNKPDLQYSIIAVLKSPDNGLWFLWILFLNYIFLFLSFKISTKFEEIYMFFFLLAINVFMHFTKWSYLGIGLLGWHLRFYLLGYVIHKYEHKINKILKILGILSFFLYPILVSYWYRTATPLFFESLFLKPFCVKIFIYIYKLIVPISGIFLVYLFFKTIINFNFLFKNRLIYLGNTSLEIYSTHYYYFLIIPFIQFLPDYNQIIIVFLIALFGSLFVSSLIKKNRFLAGIFYGK